MSSKVCVEITNVCGARYVISEEYVLSGVDTMSNIVSIKFSDCVIESLKCVPPGVSRLVLQRCVMDVNLCIPDYISELTLMDIGGEGVLRPRIVDILKMVPENIRVLSLINCVFEPSDVVVNIPVCWYKLLYLRINGCGIRSINFPDNSNIRRLSLENNLLESLYNVPRYVYTLLLSGNLFHEIPKLPLYLMCLNISNNNLQWLPVNTCDWPVNLQKLDISKNMDLGDLSGISLPLSLTYFNCMDCELDGLPRNMSSLLLDKLYISGNNCDQVIVGDIPILGDDVISVVYDVTLVRCDDNVLTVDDVSSVVCDDRSRCDDVSSAVCDGRSDMDVINVQPQQQNKESVDPLVNIDDLVLSGFKRVGSFMSNMLDLLSPLDDDAMTNMSVPNVDSISGDMEVESAIKADLYIHTIFNMYQ